MRHRRYRRDFPSPLDWLLFAALAVIVVLALKWTAPAAAQTACPAAPADPIARDALRLRWTAPTADTDGKPLVGTITYSVYELVGTAWTLRCTTTAVSAGQLGLAVGDHTYAVTAKVPTLLESARSNSATKAIPSAGTNPPTSFTIEGTIVVTGTFTITPTP